MMAAPIGMVRHEGCCQLPRNEGFMTTRKQQTSKEASSTTTGRGKRPRKGEVATRVRATSDSDGSRAAAYAVPAAVLATGLLGTAGYLFRRSLLQGLSTATKETVNAARATSDLAAGARQQAMESADVFLHRMGLKQRSSLLGSVVGPVLGAAGGFIVGAVLTYFLAPENDVRASHNGQVTPKPSSSGTADGFLQHGVGEHHSSG
jgi:hypothetical protein